MTNFYYYYAFRERYSCSSFREPYFHEIIMVRIGLAWFKLFILIKDVTFLLLPCSPFPHFAQYDHYLAYKHSNILSQPFSSPNSPSSF